MGRRHGRAVKGLEQRDAQYRKLGHISLPFVVRLSPLSVSLGGERSPSEWCLQVDYDNCGHFRGQARNGG